MADGFTAQECSPNELFLQMHLTSACNLACRHCYLDGPAQELPDALAMRAIAQFADWRARLGINTAWVQVTGGEPLLHSHFWQLLAQIAARFPTRLLTNGTLITPSVAAQLRDLGVAVQISFDGLRKQHDRWRGEGNFQRALDGLRCLADAGVSRSARITVSAENIGDVDALLDELTPLVDRMHLSRVVPIGQCAVELPDTAQYRSLIYRLYGKAATQPVIGLRDPFFGVLMQADHPGIDYCGCSAGVGGLCVTETGAILPCRRLPVELGHLERTTLDEVYTTHPLLHALRRRALAGRCGACDDRTVCGGSRCIAYALTGDPLAEDPGCIF